jgi:hypothetical protein
MSFSVRWIRLTLVGLAVVFAAAAYGIRAVMDGPIEQYSGAALSGAIVYAIVLFIRPSITPWIAGIIAVAYCWFIEFAQLTPIPATIFQHSWFAGQLVGAQFDLVDVTWYPIGILLFLAAHWYLRSRRRPRTGDVH